MPFKEHEDHLRSCSEYHARNKEMISERHRNWRKKNAEHRREYLRARRRSTIEWLRGIKADSGCVRCGEEDPLVLDFHHTNGLKDRSVADMAALGRERILIEIAGCVVLCANCHRREHTQ